MTLRRIAIVSTLFVPALAFAQPGADQGSGSAAPVPTDTVAADESRIKEIVDKEVARILTERAAKEAADKAAKEAVEKETAANDKADDLAGESGHSDTRLAFTLTNENILGKPGQTVPSTPGWRFGTPNSLGVLFFDNYDSRYSGFETLTHGVFYRSYSKGHIQAEGSVVLRFNELNENTIPISDAGSYIVLSNWKDPTHKDPTRISLTAFPVSADRFRLGYSYRLSWGGNPEYPRSRSSTPGMKLQYDWAGGYAFVGAKSALVVDPTDGELKSALAGLAGAGIDPTDMIRLEVNGGVFNRGYNELQDVQGEKVYLYGGSFQASVHKGMPIRSSVDYRLYKNNGERVSPLFAPEKYPGGLSWVAQTEFTVLAQTLKDSDKTGSTKTQIGKAGDVNIRVKLDRVRIRADFSYRDLAFILHSQPSIPTYADFPAAFKVKPNLFASVGVDNNWGDWLTLGVVAGIDKPATLTSPKGVPGVPGGGTDAMGSSTAVIRNNNIDTQITILPEGETAVAQIAVKGSAKVDFAKIFSAVLEVFYSYDGNQTRYRRTCADPDTCPFEYVFGDFNQLGVNATLQARF